MTARRLARWCLIEAAGIAVAVLVWNVAVNRTHGGAR